MAGKRVRARFRPKWVGEIEGWTVSYIRKNLWRIAPEYEFNDALQEGYVAFLKCREHYPEVVDPPHFMSLYKRIFSNWVHKTALKRTRRNEVQDPVLSSPLGDGDDGYTMTQNVPSRSKEFQDLEARLLLEDAPPVLRDAMKTLLSNPDRVYVRSDGIRETTRQRFARVTQTPAQINLPAAIRSFLTGDNWCLK